MMITACAYLRLDEAAYILSKLLCGHKDAWRTLLEEDHATHPLSQRFSYIEQNGEPLVCASVIEECLWSELDDGHSPGPGLAVGSVEGSSFEVAVRVTLPRNSEGKAVLELRVPEYYEGSPQISPADAEILADNLLYLAELCKRQEHERASAPAYPTSASSRRYGTGDPELDDLLHELSGDEPTSEPRITEAA